MRVQIPKNVYAKIILRLETASSEIQVLTDTYSQTACCKLYIGVVNLTEFDIPIAIGYHLANLVFHMEADVLLRRDVGLLNFTCDHEKKKMPLPPLPPPPAPPRPISTPMKT